MQINDAYEANHLLAHTINVPINLGSEMEDKYTVRLTPQYLERIASAGFSAIRFGVCWASHVEETSPYRIEPAALKTVDEAVKGALSRGLAVVLSNHPDVEIMKDPERYKARFLAITRQVTEHYKQALPNVLLEILAEPQGRLDPRWNVYLSEGLAIVRKVDPNRFVIVGPAAYNNARKLRQLQLPANDKRIIVTIHHYWPIKFTMQGETWVQIPWFMRLLLGGKPADWVGTPWRGLPRERKQLALTFAAVAKWGTTQDRPIFVGEFGSSNAADITSRIHWTQYIHELAERHDFSWGIWSFGPTFALYDLQKDEWHDQLLNALIPEKE